MITKCESYLLNLEHWTTSSYPITGHAMYVPSAWTWRTVEQAAARLRRPDGSRAVASVERDCRTRGMMRSVWTSGSFQPHDRSVYIAARTLHEQSLDTLFHEFGHSLLHFDVDEAQYRQMETWIEAEADVTCDLVRCLRGGGPRENTLRTLAYMGNLGDLSAFFQHAGPAMCDAAEQISAAFEPQYSFPFLMEPAPMHVVQLS